MYLQHMIYSQRCATSHAKEPQHDTAARGLYNHGECLRSWQSFWSWLRIFIDTKLATGHGAGLAGCERGLDQTRMCLPSWSEVVCSRGESRGRHSPCADTVGRATTTQKVEVANTIGETAQCTQDWWLNVFAR